MFSIPNDPTNCTFYHQDTCESPSREDCERCLKQLLELILEPPDIPEGYTAELTGWTIL